MDQTVRTVEGIVLRREILEMLVVMVYVKCGEILTLTSM